MAVVHVGNLTWSCSDDDLFNFFESSCGKGTIASAQVARYEDSGRSKGWGLVTASSEEAATGIISTMNGLDMDGRIITARPDRDAGGGGGTTLFVENLDWSCTDDDLFNFFVNTCGGEAIASAEVARHADSGRSKGWGLIVINGADAVNGAIAATNGTNLNGRMISVRQDRYGSGGGAGVGGGGGGGGRNYGSSNAGGSSSAVYVGNLAWSVNDDMLYSEFSAATGGNIVSAQVMTHADSGRSKGWGLVTFGSADAANAAIGATNGLVIGDRSVEVRLDRGKAGGGNYAGNGGGASYGGGGGGGGNYAGNGGGGNPSVVYVGNLSWNCSDDELLRVFTNSCGNANVFSAQIMRHSDTGRSKGWGLVTCSTPEAANLAVQSTNGMNVAGRSISTRLDRG